jgi:hypothetical protein
MNANEVVGIASKPLHPGSHIFVLPNKAILLFRKRKFLKGVAQAASEKNGTILLVRGFTADQLGKRLKNYNGYVISEPSSERAKMDLERVQLPIATVTYLNPKGKLKGHTVIELNGVEETALEKMWALMPKSRKSKTTWDSWFVAQRAKILYRKLLLHYAKNRLF